MLACNNVIVSSKLICKRRAAMQMWRRIMWEEKMRTIETERLRENKETRIIITSLFHYKMEVKL